MFENFVRKFCPKILFENIISGIVKLNLKVLHDIQANDIGPNGSYENNTQHDEAHHNDVSQNHTELTNIQ